ncbi:hypothetical protein [Tsukamurella soli]
MTVAQRRALIQRLERPAAELIHPVIAARIRRVRVSLMMSGSVALIPWIVFLGLTLPNRYVADHWSATWIGFDALLVLLMAMTAYFGWRRRMLLLLTGFATGVLLVCDAWFDIMTSEPHDLPVSLATAAFAELPLAAVLILGPLRIMRLVASRLWLLETGMRVWHLEFPF